MEMTYDGALVLPSNCVTMDEEEMEYIDGGISWSTAKTIVISAITWAVCEIAKKGISKSAVGAVINCMGGWIANAIDTMILLVWYHPWISVAVGGAVAFGVYYAGRRMRKW